MRISVLACLLTLLATASALAQSPPTDKQAPLPTVDKNLVIKGENFGRIFERFRPQVGAYLKEIEEAKDYANWKVPPSKSFEQKE